MSFDFEPYFNFLNNLILDRFLNLWFYQIFGLFSYSVFWPNFQFSPYFLNRVYFGNFFFRMNRILTFRLVRVRRNSGLIKKESSEGSTDLLANIEKPTRILQTKNERTIMTASGSFVQKPPVLNLIKLTPTLSHLKL